MAGGGRGEEDGPEGPKAPGAEGRARQRGSLKQGSSSPSIIMLMIAERVAMPFGTLTWCLS